MVPMHIVQVRLIFYKSLYYQLTSQTKIIKSSEDKKRKPETYSEVYSTATK